ncbi:HisZ ATP phosphoribosyltransferase involved in histidine biosynthesis [Rhabdaerophilaceae bacterium]
MDKRDKAQRIARGALSTAADRAAGPRLLGRFLRAGFSHSDVAILQPAEHFLELSGEDIRRRLFVTIDEAGEELCLRPEFTIPAAIAYLKSGIAGRRADLAFFGPVFRHRPGDTGEFLQFGAESIGRADREAADADMLAEIYASVRDEVATGSLAVRLGDLALFARLLEELALSPALARKLSLALADGRIETILNAAARGERADAKGIARYSGVLDALKGADPAEAKAFVKDLLSLAGISAVGGRSAEDIASRFLDRAREDSQSLSAEQAEILRRFLGIAGDPDHVARQLRDLAGEASLDLDVALDRFELRTGFLEARGFKLETLEAAAGFARNLDYYSGFVFDIQCAGAERPLAGGGRYDRLFSRLGAEVPAIGAAIWVERLLVAGEPA